MICLLFDSFNTEENFELQGPFPLILCDGRPHVFVKFKHMQARGAIGAISLLVWLLIVAGETSGKLSRLPC